MLLLTACMFDKYSEKRPFDYGEAKWSCITDDYSLYFYVNLDKEDYYYPEGEIKLGESTYFCKFYFIHQTNQLSVSVYPLEYKDIPDEYRNREDILFELSGVCNFNPNSFTVCVDKPSDTLFNGEVEELIFLREERIQENGSPVLTK